jgi:hypothetical protein
MLNETQIYNNKMKFLELLSKLNIDLTSLTKYLDAQDYFNKPASSQFFKPYPGGLCQYALDLYYELAQLVNAYCPGKYTEEDVIKVALFKDIYKAELFEAYAKNIKNDLTGQWEQTIGYKYKEDRAVYGDLPFSSFMTARKFVDFTEEQIEAIMHSTVSGSYGGDIHEILRKYQLVTLTRMADIAACYLD